MNQKHDDHDAEFEAFLRQFQPRRPPVLKTGGRVMLTKLAIAAAVLIACVTSFRLLSTAPEQAIAARNDLELQRTRSPRALNLIPYVEATLSASAPETGPVAVRAYHF